MPPPTPPITPRANEWVSRSPRTTSATRSATKPAACEMTVTARTGSRRVSEPPPKSAQPHTTEDPRARRSENAPRLVQPLDKHGHSLPAADAHRLEPDRPVHRLEIVQERVHDPRARHPVRMAERDRAAVRVQLVAERIHAELAAYRQHLRGERLVQLNHVDVLDRHAGVREHLAHRLD